MKNYSVLKVRIFLFVQSNNSDCYRGESYFLLVMVLGKNCSFPTSLSFQPWEEDDHRGTVEGVTSSDPPPVATGCDAGTSSSRALALFILRLEHTSMYRTPSPPSLCSHVAFLVRPTRTALQNHKLFTSLSPVSLFLHYFVFHNVIFQLR